jgi:hypothetical protein
MTRTKWKTNMRALAAWWGGIFLALATAGCPPAGPQPNPNACQNREEGWCGRGKVCRLLPDGSGSKCEPLDDGGPRPDGPDAMQMVGLTDGAGNSDELGQGEQGGRGGNGANIGGAGGGSGGSAGTGGMPGQIDGGGGDMVVISPPSPGPDAGADTVPPACINACTIGQAECVGAAGLRSCVMLASGCTGWGTPAVCPAPQICPTGKAKCECPTATCAVASATECGAGGGVRTCKQMNGCFLLGPEVSCKPYRCSSGDCAEHCKSDTECVSSHECLVNDCLDRCRGASSANIFPNAGFDKGVDGWFLNELAPARAARWDAFLDSSGCTKSGSLKVDNAEASLSPLLPIQTGSLVHVGFRVQRASPDPSIPPCTIHWCKSSACRTASEVLGTDELYARPAAAGQQWEASDTNLMPPPTIVGARLLCVDGHYDHFYWSYSSSVF